MKIQFSGRRITGAFLVLLLAWMGFGAPAQTYHIDWFKVSGGGGTSTNGHYFVTGTIGQADASGPMTGGSYSMTGGLWSLLNVVQTAGLPALAITHSGDSVIIFWPATGSYTLQQNANLADHGGWTPSGFAISTANGTNSVTVTSPVGNLFFRLKQ
jgi:hypothetical protein